MSPSKRMFVALMVVCVFGAGASRPTYASPILLDQSFLGGTGSVSGNVPFSQTFTVGIEGTLANVLVNIFGLTDVIIDIRQTIGGVPLLSDAVADQLGRVTVTPPSSGFALVSADFGAFGISVRPGDLLAIVLRSSGVQNWGVALNQDATYLRGEAFLRPDADWQTFDQVFPGISEADFQFQTFVQPIPEPSTLALVGLGLAYGGRRLRQWRRYRGSRCPRWR